MNRTEIQTRNRVQIEIRVNVSVNMTQVVQPKKTPVYTAAIQFRLNPVANQTTTTATSEIYYNQKLVEKLRQFQPKYHVDLSRLNLVDRDMVFITNEVLSQRKCTELWLCTNQLTSQGMKILASNLQQNSVLKSLDLSSNPIGNSGVKELCRALSNNDKTRLKILYLTRNQITNEGIMYLCEMLEQNRILKELWLSENEITEQGLEQLARILNDKNQTLKVLSLSMNKFPTDKSIDYLSEIINKNQVLRKLYLKDCDLPEQGKLKLRDLVKQKKKILLEL